MLRASALLIAWLIASPAWAFLPGQPVGMLNPQALPSNASAGLPAVDDNLAAGGYPIAGGICAEWGHQVPCNNHYSTTRASTKYVSASDGLFTSVLSNVLAMGSNTGALPEESRTNLALWARDLTQSGTWVAVTMTAAKNAVGIDGVATSATTLTSTSPAGTILQSLTQASAAYTYTVYVKGVTVTGAIQVADYPVLTPAFTTLSSANCFNPAGTGVAPTSGQAGFLRCTVTATSLNPVIGFKFANSGDSIVVDFNQLEAASFGTSPILTTSATATRASDNISSASVLIAALNTPPYSFVASTGGTLNATARVIDDSTDSQTQLFFASTTVRSAPSTGQIIATIGGSLTDANAIRVAVGYDASGGSVVGANGTVATGVNQWTSTNIPPRIGSSNGSSNFYDGYIMRLSTWNGRLADATLKALSQ